MSNLNTPIQLINEMEQQKPAVTAEDKRSATYQLPLMIGQMAAAVAAADAAKQIQLPAPKYVSVFRIDGVPILPPLMTVEKRRQMLKIKEKAVKAEEKLQEKHHKKLCFERKTSLNLRKLPDPLAHSPVDTTSGSASICSYSYRLSDIDECKQREEDSYRMLSNILQRHKEVASFIGAISSATATTTTETSPGKMYANASTSLEAKRMERNLDERIQKLQKSETLIYDNRSNTIILPMTEQEEQRVQDKHEQLEDVLKQKCETIYLKDMMQKTHLSYLSMPTASFSLQRQDELLKPIPSICVNPPTPLVDSRSFCDVLSATESVDSIDMSDMKRPLRNAESETGGDTLSSDDSFTYPQQTGSGRSICELNAKRKITNITTKIIQFEQLNQSDSSGGGNGSHTVLSCDMKPPQRSATSPALKQLTVRTPNIALDLNQSKQSEMPLVRSGSFTLECPSKALLDHMRQQKAIDTKRRSKPQNQQMPSSRTRRDTVESKAKRVHKVEPKPRPYVVRPSAKSTQSHNVIPHSASPYANRQNPIDFKNKRSPYDVSTSAGKSKLSRSLKNTVSTTNALQKQVRPRSSTPSLGRPALATSSSKNGTLNADAVDAMKPTFKSSMFLEIEAEHQQKLEMLVAQQQEEQRRLQRTFELQQKMLLDELSHQMVSVRLHSSPSQEIESNLDFCAEGIAIESSPSALKSDFSEPCGYKSPSTGVTNSGTPSTVGYCDLGSSYERSSSCATIIGSVVNGNSTQRCTPRRRLFAPESGSTAIVIGGSNNGGNGSGLGSGNMASTNSSSANRRQIEGMQNDSARRSWAASKINAGARGFLVRRLFQTEQIQRIVQTIRDTLIFVLNLHLETGENTTEAQTPANIRLKARLLQQLSSASRTLYLVFFQTTIKERMEIIARDRKRIKTKLLSLNLKRSPRTI